MPVAYTRALKKWDWRSCTFRDSVFEQLRSGENLCNWENVCMAVSYVIQSQLVEGNTSKQLYSRSKRLVN